MDPKGSNLASTDLLEISELVSGSYVTKSITGQEIIDSIPVPPSGITIGTTAITSGTVGRVLFEGTGNVVQESANLFFDVATSFFGVGTSTTAANTRMVINESFTAQSSIGLRIKGNGSSTNIWKGRLVAGGDTVAFLMGEYKSMAWLGGHNAALNAWAPLYINPDGGEDLYLGSRTLNVVTPIMTLRNATGNVLINTTTDAGYKLDVNGTARVVTKVVTPILEGASSGRVDLKYGFGTSTPSSNILSVGYGGEPAILIGSGTTQNSSMIQMNSTTQGFLPPRMTTTQKNAIATPSSGLELFDLTTLTPSIYNGTNWQDVLVPNSNGNVLINTTTDAGFKLDVNGTARVVGQATIQTLTIGLGAASVANNTALGFQALNANTTGSGNTATGYQSMLANTTGVNNAAFGISAMSGSTTGNDNSALGYYALAGANTGSSNTAIGNRSLIVNTSGSYNTAVGRSALNSNTTGQLNTAVGYFALRLNVIGQNNVAVGDNALSASTGDVNTAVGTSALSATTTGQFNTAIGASALNANTTGSGNTAVGFSTQTGNFNNSVILGWGATATASNQFVIGTAARNAGAVVTQVNTSTKYWEVVINGVTQKVLLA